ncbi:gamma-glutamylcyclotransferase [Paracoccaceae bacterium Fryx2]|nr:gamma-glutamylcyclotransferase [Paracoccaceae bacterium Fryx2]
MADFFFYGTLCHAPLLRVVLGRNVAARPARLDGHAVHWADGGAFPLIVEDAGGRAEGVLVTGMTAEDVARLDFYEGGFAYHTRDLAVEAGGAATSARVYFPDPGHWVAAAPWSLADWQAVWGETVVATADAFMALYGRRPPQEVLARYGQMLVRGASRVRAETRPAPTLLRHSARPGDVVIAAQHQPYARFFAVEEYDLRFRRFDGSLSPEVNRAVFISGDAVTVLPYDPVRDRVLLVEQFRAAPLARGDRQPWMLEAIAGRIDPGETPEEAVRREAREEAGLVLDALELVASYYPSPGAKSEFLYSYVALTDLPDGAAGIFGVEGEAEDIRGHLVGFEALMALVASGEAAVAPLILSALWLQRERPRLRRR